MNHRPYHKTTHRSVFGASLRLMLTLGVLCAMPAYGQVISTNGAVFINNTAGTVIGSSTLQNNSGATLTNNGGLNVTDVANAGTMNGDGALTVSGAFTNSGTFTPAGSTVEFSGASAQTIPGIDFHTLVISGAGTTTLSATTSITGDLTLSGGTYDLSSFTSNRATLGGTFSIAASCTLRIGGNGTTLPSNFSAYSFDPAAKVEYYGTNQSVPGGTYQNLNVSGSGTSIVLGANVDVVGDLVITDGTLDLAAYTANRSTSGGTLSVGSGGTLKIGGTNTMPANYASYAFDPASTVEFSGTSHTVGAFDFGNLTVSASGTITFPNGGTVRIAGDFIPGSATYVTTGNTVEYNSAGAQSIGAINYNDLTLSTGGTKTFPSGTTSIAGTLSISGASADVTTNSAIIEYNGSSAQTVIPMTYYDLTLTNGGTKSIFGTVTVNRNLLVNTAAILTVDTAGTLLIHADIDNSGTINNHGTLTVAP